MYSMYMPIAKELYEKVKQKREDGAFEPYGRFTEQERYEDYMYHVFSNYKTDRTIGFEKDSNIGYVLIKCLKTIDKPLAETIESRLNKYYSIYVFSGETEIICQKYFNYGKDHLKNIIEMIDEYHDSLESVNQSLLGQNVLDILPTIKQIVSTEEHSIEDVDKFIAKLESSNCDLTSFCDDVEMKMKNIFVENLNKETQKTIKEIEANPSRLKRMNGQDFNLIIHSSLTPEDFIKNSGSKYHNMLSTSLIDDRNIRCYQSYNVKFAFYQGIDQENMISAFSGDAVTSFSDHGILTSFKVPDYIPTKNFKNKTREGQGISSYSEIMLKGDVRPNAIVCFDYVTEQEKDLAEKYDLDLILIETEYYKDMLKGERGVDERYIRKADLSNFEYENML